MMDFKFNHIYQQTFEKQALSFEVSDPLERAIMDEMVQLSTDFDLSQFQQSWSWRNLYLARVLSRELINERGELTQVALVRAIELLEANLHSLGPERQHDCFGKNHILKILRLFQSNRQMVQALKSIFRPLEHAGAQKLIYETLDLPHHMRLTDAHAREAALAAMLTYLRQNVGSCFATAPAIIIQQDQPLMFLTDIKQLLATGRLTRIVEGTEYSVPLSHSWGMGDLLRPIPISTFGKNRLEIMALSPGLQAAFERAGLISNEATREKKREICKELLQKSEKLTREPFAILTAKQIIQQVLLAVFEVTEEEVAAYQDRLVDLHAFQMMIESVKPQAGNKTIAVSRFLKAYEAAKEAFKSLTDNALLKSWEFTLASLSESKADFAKWNLYSSLGIHPEDRYGIGESLYAKIQEEMVSINQEIEEYQSRYDHLFAQARYLEGRMAGGASESEVGWIRAEYQIRRQEINRLLSERDAAYDKGTRLQNLYPRLIKFYGEKIPAFFQEVYDPEMHDVSASPYDDSPAGFRLMYKHGRSNTALWSMIHSPAEYIQYLTQFFIANEAELNQLPELEGLQKITSALITSLLMTIKRPEFLESSIFRLAKSYREPSIHRPLENLEKVQRKPWSYISGGTMGTLVSCYWRKSDLPKESKRWIENETEYLAFLIDSIKELPHHVQKIFQKESEKNMLSFSPTHAFNCKPGWNLYRLAWESDLYTYTWIRDYWVVPQQKFLDEILLDRRMMERLFQQFLQSFPADYRKMAAQAYDRLEFSLTPVEFREKVLQFLSYEKWLRKGAYLEPLTEALDNILYLSLPLFPEYQLRERLIEIFEDCDGIDKHLREQIIQLIPILQENIGKYQILTAQELKNFAKMLLIMVLKKTRTDLNYHEILLKCMRSKGFCYPEPFLFADTNWIQNLFGFTVNPGTRQVEFWRFDAYGENGRPMNAWKHYLNGKDRADWGLYTNPRDYGQFA